MSSYTSLSMVNVTYSNSHRPYTQTQYIPPTIVDYRRVQSLGSLFLTRAIDAQYGLRMFVCETDKNKRHFRIFDQVIYIYIRNNLSFFMCTERGGFEPPDAFASTVFKTVSFDHSDISLFLLVIKNLLFSCHIILRNRRDNQRFVFIVIRLALVHNIVFT